MLYIFVTISISLGVKFMHILLSRISLALILVFAYIGLQAQEIEPGVDGGAKATEANIGIDVNEDWAASVEDTNIDFGRDDSESRARSALNEVQKISRDIQILKGEVIDLNKDLMLMEEKLLFPSSTKVSFFVSATSGQFFEMESVKLKIDGRFVATHIYSKKQREALLRGGVHKLFITNLSEGKHDIIAFFTGIGPGDRAYKRASELRLKKGPGSQYLEIAISDDTVAQEPTFKMKLW